MSVSQPTRVVLVCALIDTILINGTEADGLVGDTRYFDISDDSESTSNDTNTGHICSICMDYISNNESVSCDHNCAERFHKECLELHFALNDNRCPYCRQQQKTMHNKKNNISFLDDDDSPYNNSELIKEVCMFISEHIGILSILLIALILHVIKSS